MASWEEGRHHSARDSDRLARLMEATRRLASEADRGRLLPYLLESAIGLTGAERGFILVKGTEGTTCAAGIPSPDAAGAWASHLSRGILARVIERRESVLSVDLSADERFRMRASVRRSGLRSVLAVPFAEGRGPGGALYLDSRAGHTLFRPDDLELLGAFAVHASLALGPALAADAATDSPLAPMDPRKRHAGDGGAHRIIGATPSMRRALDVVARVAPTDLPVLIVGESGTGKELIARAIHAASLRAAAPFVAENCAAIPETLLESELFGSVRGAYTGAERDREGLFRAAEKGTLFLDEIGEMPLGFQARLLRALQEQEVRPVGASRPVRVDARIVAATNRDPAGAIASGRLRLDLYYRIAGVTIEIPPLRERREDIPALASNVLARLARTMRSAPLRISDEALGGLMRYDWPGNVRELENETERAAVLTSGPEIRFEDLSPRIREAAAPHSSPPHPSRSTGEGVMIESALLVSGGSVTVAAAAIGWSRQKLYRRMAKLGISRSYGRHGTES